MGEQNIESFSTTMFHIKMTPIVECLEHLSLSLPEQKISKISGKLFLFAHSIWQKSAPSITNSIMGILSQEESTYCLNKNKAYNVLRTPRYMTFNLEYEKYFEFTSEEVENRPENYRR
jgi:hypothetical protein